MFSYILVLLIYVPSLNNLQTTARVSLYFSRVSLERSPRRFLSMSSDRTLVSWRHFFSYPAFSGRSNDIQRRPGSHELPLFHLQSSKVKFYYRSCDFFFQRFLGGIWELMQWYYLFSLMGWTTKNLGGGHYHLCCDCSTLHNCELVIVSCSRTGR